MKFSPPKLPKEVTSFDCITHGRYCARGYNPSLTRDSISGIPIAYLTSEGDWLNVDEFGSGSTLIFRDKNGKELGRTHKPSAAIADQFPSLTFRKATL